MTSRTVSSAFFEARQQLLALYDERESAAIAHELLEHLTGMTKTQRLTHKNDALSPMQNEQWQRHLSELLQGRPIQYVTGAAWFMGHEYHVNEHVLIPRPETEELVQWIIHDHPHRQPLSILDIGTGSGCIAIALQLALQASVSAIDISAEAITIASGNAARLGATVSFKRADILDSSASLFSNRFDIIVSNPPYIALSEAGAMHENVKGFEPHLALFVPDNEATMFYRAIAAFSKHCLAKTGRIYCELNPIYASECRGVFENSGFSMVELRNDMHGKLRMLRASAL